MYDGLRINDLIEYETTLFIRHVIISGSLTNAFGFINDIQQIDLTSQPNLVVIEQRNS